MKRSSLTVVQKRERGRQREGKKVHPDGKMKERKKKDNNNNNNNNNNNHNDNNKIIIEKKITNTL